MKFKWMLAAVSVVFGGAALLFLQRKFKRGVLHFMPDTDDGKNFGAFPPEIPHYEFEGIDFV